ncbi:hypothetical protein GCM10023321_00820 [Pseudonocardia eucalypti]|uniref:DUF3566 domain-containing protein n=1 Tax=Pseudonocardia eucalypti TaxID=648755 RepID=A0ABP9PCN8_9PSEU|nr:hypothetical protein [Pseudonocardia eucalypti]
MTEPTPNERRSSPPSPGKGGAGKPADPGKTPGQDADSAETHGTGPANGTGPARPSEAAGPGRPAEPSEAAERSRPAEPTDGESARNGTTTTGAGKPSPVARAESAAPKRPSPVRRPGPGDSPASSEASDPAASRGSGSEASPAAPGAEDDEPAGRKAEAAEVSAPAGYNGHAEAPPPVLPPPWQRIPAGPAPSGTAGPSQAEDLTESPATTSAGLAASRPAPPRPPGPGGRPNPPAPPGPGGGSRKPGRPGKPAKPGKPRPSGPPMPPGMAGRVGGSPIDPATTDMRRPVTSGLPGDPDADHGRSGPGGLPMSWARGPRRPRQAALQLKRLDPWSVLKIALVLAVVLYLVWLIAAGLLYGVLDGMGVWDRLNGQYADLVAEQSSQRLISAGRVFGMAAVIGAINSLLVAVALSVAAFIYNVSADLVGGIEVTLSERE